MQAILVIIITLLGGGATTISFDVHSQIFKSPEQCNFAGQEFINAIEQATKKEGINVTATFDCYEFDIRQYFKKVPRNKNGKSTPLDYCAPPRALYS